jgi:hypothetical protein
MRRNCHPTTLPRGWSVARYWNEVALGLVRDNPPAPTVVARNMFSLSAAMWDAWAAYDPDADGYFYVEKATAANVADARDAAISFAAFRVLSERYFSYAWTTPTELPEEFVHHLSALCYRADFVFEGPESPAGLGNRIARRVVETGLDDGSLEDQSYVDPSYKPINKPIRALKSGTVMKYPNHWQPIRFPAGRARGQGGGSAPDTQTFVGAQWGRVTPFALGPSAGGLAMDPGPPPALGSDATLDEQFKQAAIQIIEYSSTLDPRDDVEIDISPGALGNNSLGTNDGAGRATNPATGKAYDPNIVLRADYERALAEYWADGPSSETPPGHWNLIANYVSDSANFEFRFAGGVPLTDRLEWDVKMYFALNGALHDAAIAAWGIKRFYDSARPISMIRYMAGLGQSSDPSLPHYDLSGLPLVPGLVELITRESSASGKRHHQLRDHIGEIAVRAWRGFPDDPATETSGVGWILGANWVPYQRPSFITPAFPGYVSGHSTYSRAAAEVLTALTGSEFFPGGLFAVGRTRGSLRHEKGPIGEVLFQWATYYDAADSAGISRLYMGIHIPQDDFEGRKIGSTCGIGAWDLALRYFDGDVDQ